MAATPVLRSFATAFAFAFVVMSAGQLAIAQSISGPMDGEVSTLNDGVPKDVENVTVTQRLGESVPLTLDLVDSLGRKVKTARFFDGTMPVIVTLNYSNCPMLCNVQLNQLAVSLKELDLRINEDFRLLSVSIDPREPTEKVRETKAKYVAQLPTQPGAEQGWAFCTANQATITKLAKAFGFQYTYDKKTKEYYHPAMLAFVSPDGVITRYSLGVDFPTDQLRLSLLDAGQGNVGGVVDQVLLWCYSYDSEKNRYVAQAWTMMRLGGLLTVGLMLATLTPFWVGRKYRNRTREELQELVDDESTPEIK